MRHESLKTERLETRQPSRPDIPALGLFSCARLLELRSVAQRCPANSSSDDGKSAAQACTDQRETGHSRADAAPIPAIKK